MARHKQLLALMGAFLVGCGVPQPAAIGVPARDPAGYFITQYTHPRYHPDPAPAANANCGPTSLAMALRAFGAVQAPTTGSTEGLIAAVRQAMTGSRDVTSWTYPYQFPHAASSYGLKGQVFTGGVSVVLQQLARPGRLVVVNVNPTPAYVSQLSIPYNGGHFALVTGYEGERVFLNDPLADGPITISRSQLDVALRTPLGADIPAFGGGIAIWK